MTSRDQLSMSGERDMDSPDGSDNARDGLADDEMLVELKAGEAEIGDEFIEYERAPDDTLIERKFKIVRRPRAPDASDAAGLTDKADRADKASLAPVCMADTHADVADVADAAGATEDTKSAETGAVAIYRFDDQIETIVLPGGYHEATEVFARALIPEPLPDPQMGHMCQLTPSGVNTTWVTSADAVLTTLARLRREAPLKDLNLYLGVSTAMTHHQSNARVQNATATDVLGFGGDIDMMNALAHAGDQLPPDVASAMELIDAFGLEWSLIVNSAHGYQPWLLPPMPWLWEQNDTASRERAALLRQAIQLRLAHLAEARGYRLDTVQDHARLLRLPGTINRKKLRDGSGYLPMAPVTLERVSAARYSIEHLEDFLHAELAELKRGEAGTPAKKPRVTPGIGADKTRKKASLTASDQELLEKILSAKGAEKFSVLWEGGSVFGDVSRDDASLMRLLAFWTNGDAERMDRLFRCSQRMREKCDQRHYAAGNEYGVCYGEHLINKTLAEWMEDGDGYVSETPADAPPATQSVAPASETESEAESEGAAGEISDAARVTGEDASAGECSREEEDDAQETFSPFDDSFPYPGPLAPAAYYGLVGDYVARIAPHTESDPVAVLGQLLTGFGAMLGRHS